MKCTFAWVSGAYQEGVVQLSEDPLLLEYVLLFLSALQLVLVDDLHRVDLTRVFLPHDCHFREAAHRGEPQDVECFEVHATDRFEEVRLELDALGEDLQRHRRPGQGVVVVDVPADRPEASDRPHVEVGGFQLGLEIRVEQPVDRQLVAHAARGDHLNFCS